MPTVTDGKGLAEHDGSTVTVVGTYEQQDIRMMRSRPATLHTGHAGIVLRDGTVVLLLPPEDDEAIRPPEEIALWEHRQVRVTGVVLERIPTRYAALRTPCFLTVEAIEQDHREIEREDEE